MSAEAAVSPGTAAGHGYGPGSGYGPGPGYGPVATRLPYARPRKVLGDPTPLACTVAKAALEAALGADTVGTLTRWLAPGVRESVARQFSLARRAGKRGGEAVRIVRVRVFRVSAMAAEVSVVADDGTRCRALAMRLEELSGRWLITALDIG